MLQNYKATIYLKFLILFWIIIISIPLKLYALPLNKILQPVFHPSPRNETIKIQTTQRPEFQVLKFENPKRLVFNIKNSYYPLVHHTKSIAGKKIKQIRLSQNTKTQTRVVIDLIKDADCTTSIIELKNDKYVLQIDIPIVKDSNLKVVRRISTSIKPILLAQLAPSMPFDSFHQNTQKSASLPLSSEEPATESKLAPDENKTTFILANLDLANSDIDESIFDENEEIKEKKDFNLSGSILLRPTLDLHNDKTNENLNSFKNITILEASYKNKFVISGISDYLYFGDNDETDDYNLDFYELYFKHNTGGFNISIGKQIKRWGKTDQISPIDTLNPENVTEFIIPPYEERKIPVWMADIMLKKNNFFIEGVFIPFFEPSRFEYFGTDWAVFSHLKSDINDSNLAPDLKSYFNALSVNQTEPDQNSDMDNFEYALRVGGTIKKMDFGLTYHYAFEDLPYFKSFPVKNLSLDNPNSIQSLASNMGNITLTNQNIETTFKRTNIFGFEFETVFSDIGIRGEAVWKDNESFLTNSFTSVRNPTLFWVIGMDYTSENNLYFNLQFAHQHISDYNSSILYFEEDNYSIIGEINKDIFSDWLNASFQYTLFLNEQSYYLSPRLVYSYIKNLEVTLGVNLFEGTDNSIFGRYDTYDQFFMNLKYHF